VKRRAICLFIVGYLYKLFVICFLLSLQLKYLHKEPPEIASGGVRLVLTKYFRYCIFLGYHPI